MTSMLNDNTTAATEAERAPLANLRDFGGMRVAGGTIAPGVLWRGDDITLSPADEVAALAQAGLGLSIDLRATNELAATGTGFLAESGIRHHHLPLMNSTADPATLAASFASITGPADVGRWYAGMFRDRSSELVQALELIADSRTGVLFHCAAGKDRTGVLAAAILTVLGAEPETIIADYATTHANVPGVMARIAETMKSSGMGHGGPSMEELKDHPMLGARPEAMASMLQDLESQGGAREILRAAGCEDALEQRLRARLVVADA